MKKIILFVSILLISTALMAQDFPYEKASKEELDMKNYDKDTSANALVLNEFGKSTLRIAVTNDVRLTFEYHVRIKIFNHKGFSHGSAELILRNNENNYLVDNLDDISGMTTYIDDNGAVRVTELDKGSIYKKRLSKYATSVKFAMPALRDGCVVEFRYILVTPFFVDHFHNWQFQSYIPKLHTEYEAHIPAYWTYKISLKGPLNLSKELSEAEHGCFSLNGSACDCVKLDYAMTNVPAFISEEYMTSPKNYLSALNFDLEEYTTFSGVKKQVTKEWKDVDRELKDNSEFGSQLKKISAVKEHLPQVVFLMGDTVEKARTIFRLVQSWFKWNNITSIYSYGGIKKALDAHSGSIADINLTLINALNAAGIKTDAVLLSTRDHGLISRLYPVIDDFNYIIAKANINGKSYFLDASNPLLPFGIIPEKCINDQGRVFSMDKASYWVDLGMKQHKSSTYTFDLTLQEDGKLKGKFIHYSIGYDAYLKREAIKKFNSTDEYIEGFYGRLPKVKILKANFTNIDSLDMPLSEEYEIEIDTKDNSSRDHFSINPYLFHRLTINPFRLAERAYPVDMGMAMDDRLILHLKVPEQYTVTGKPVNRELLLADKDAEYTTAFEGSNNNLTFSSSIRFNKVIFAASEYLPLKEFYNKVILAEKSDITFTKK